MEDRSLGILINSGTVPYPDDPHGDLDLPVMVRLDWYRVGEEWVEATAVERTHELVRVVLADGRRSHIATWLRPDDVKRRSTWFAGNVENPPPPDAS